MTTLPYRLEYAGPGGAWFCPAGSQDTSLRYLEGYADAYTERSPRLALRIVRAKDGRVMREVPASSAPQIGMIAGYPTAGQCINAARRALGSGWESCALPATDEERTRIAAARAVLG